MNCGQVEAGVGVLLARTVRGRKPSPSLQGRTGGVSWQAIPPPQRPSRLVQDHSLSDAPLELSGAAVQPIAIATYKKATPTFMEMALVLIAYLLRLLDP